MEIKKIVGIFLVLVMLLAGALMNWLVTPRPAGGDTLYPQDTHSVDLRGQELPSIRQLCRQKNLQQLDLRDTGLNRQQYDKLARELTNCTILWTVPMREGPVDSGIRELALTKLTAGDLEMLKYLQSLETLEIREAVGHADIPMLVEWMNHRPEVSVDHTLELEGREYTLDTRELELKKGDPDAVDAALAVLPQLERISFTKEDPQPESVERWMREHPQVVFVWNFEVCGVQANSLDTELILNDIPMESLDAVEAALPFFYNLEKVEMCDCGIPSEDIDALWKRNPQTRFVWSVWVGDCYLRTDETTFMPYKFGYDGPHKLHDRDMTELKYCVDLMCVDLGHMEITDYSFLAYMPKMKYLILAETLGTDFSVLAELKELIYLELFLTAFDQAEILTGLTNLQDLNIGNSGLDNIEPLLEMTWLERLWLPGTLQVTREERQRLVAEMPDTIVMFACNGSTGAGWRETPNYYAMRDLLGMEYMPGW